MKIKDEIEFWKKAKKLISEGYGIKPCGELDLSCANCQAQIAYGWISNHINLLDWEKQEPKPDKLREKVTEMYDKTPPHGDDELRELLAWVERQLPFEGGLVKQTDLVAKIKELMEVR